MYGKSAESKPTVKVSDVSAISIPRSGNSTVFSAVNADLELEQRDSAVIADFNFKPREGLNYRLRVGQVQDFQLEFSSGSQTNKLESFSQKGFIWGLGLSGSLSPGTMVSTAISWDVGFTQTRVNLDRFQGGPDVFAIDDKFEQNEIQAAVNFSRRIKSFEPYAGLKLMRTESILKDDATKQKISGVKSTVSPFLGVQWAIAEREHIFVEGSLVGEESVAAGFDFRF